MGPHLEIEVFADDQVKIRSLGWALSNRPIVLIKRGNLDTEKDTHRERTPCKDEGRD